MAVDISVMNDLFIITIDDVTTLTKNKEDIFCRVSPDDSTITEIWETSPDESKRNLIFSSLYTNFSSPTGSTAAFVCYGINQLLKNGSPLNQDTPYAFLSCNATQNIADISLGQEVPFDINESINFITHSVSSNTSRIYAQYEGQYVIHFEAIVTSASANKDVYIWLRVNGVDVARSNNQQSIVNSSDTKAMTCTWQNYLNVGDYFEIVFGGNSTAVSLPYYSTITNPTRPTTPSANLTVELV